MDLKQKILWFRKSICLKFYYVNAVINKNSISDSKKCIEIKRNYLVSVLISLFKRNKVLLCEYKYQQLLYSLSRE